MIEYVGFGLFCLPVGILVPALMWIGHDGKRDG